MSTIIQAGRQILEAMSFANVNNLREFRALLGQVERIPDAPRASGAREASPPAHLRDAIAHAAEPVRGVL